MRSQTLKHFATLAAACGLACVGSPNSTEEAGSSDYQRQMNAESIAVSNERETVYQRRMGDLARRTLLVPTDSIAQLSLYVERRSEISGGSGKPSDVRALW